MFVQWIRIGFLFRQLSIRSFQFLCRLSSAPKVHWIKMSFVPSKCSHATSKFTPNVEALQRILQEAINQSVKPLFAATIRWKLRLSPIIHGWCSSTIDEWEHSFCVFICFHDKYNDLNQVDYGCKIDCLTGGWSVSVWTGLFRAVIPKVVPTAH